MRKPRILLFTNVGYLLVLCSLQFTKIAAFPSWLKCFVEFDESEVIMGSYVTPFEKASHKVELVVRDNKEGDWTSNYEYNDDSTIVQVKLKIPKELDDPYNPLQFVLETSTDGAEFVEGGRMCDGQRAFSGSEPVTLKIGNVESVDVVGIWATGAF